MIQSAIYECSVSHQRLVPVRHGFCYRVFYLWLDLDELGALDRALALLSVEKFGLFSVHASDHLGGSAADLKQGFLEQWRLAGIDTGGIHRVRMLAFPRVLGYGFNPVVFVFGFDQEDRPVAAMAQVTNTFREQKLFAMPPPGADGQFRLVAPKEFYVSPFSGLELCFDFQLEVPGEQLRLVVDVVTPDGQSKVLASLLQGERVDLSDSRLLRNALLYPLLTLKVISMIHWQAFLLWMRRAPFFRKSARPELQTRVLRPHHSIRKPSPT
jgi:DUF1365 family protein